MPKALRRFDSGREFYMVASRSDNFKANYFQPEKSTWLDIVKASSAIPAFYRNGVLFQDVVYHDGGISDAIPVKEAYRRGCRSLSGLIERHALGKILKFHIPLLTHVHSQPAGACR